jgi:hypothetical protein
MSDTPRSTPIEARSRQSLYAFLAFLSAAFLTAGPMLMHLHLPLVDLPNHIARHSIATASPGPLDVYYTYQLKLVPNAAADLAWIATGGAMDPSRFSQLTMAFYCLAFIGSIMGLSRFLHGHWSPWPAAASLVVFNACFFWGFQNFLVSVPFAILGLILWLWSERLPLTQRLLILSPFVLLLYVMHFFAFATLAVTTFGREIQRIAEAGKDWKSALLQASLLAIPYLIPILWLLSDVLFGPESPAGSKTSFGGLDSRLFVLTSISDGIFQALPVALKLTGWAIALAIVLFALTLLRKTGTALSLSPKMRGPLTALAIAAILSPTWLNGVAFVHVRFAFIAAALFFASTEWRNLPLRKAQILAAAILAILILRGVAFERYAANHTAETLDFIAATESIPAGERLLPVYNHRADGRDFRLWHIAANAVTYHQAFIPTLFQGVHALQVKPQWAKHAIAAGAPAPVQFLDTDAARGLPSMEFVWDWQDKFTYLVMLDSDRSTLAPYDQLEFITLKGRFSLYRINNPS